MIFEFSDEHGELRRTVRSFLEQESDEARVRELMADRDGFDAELWRRLAGELGIVGLIVDERYGGAGFGNVELAIVMEELGRGVVCAPFLSSAVMATSALALAADEPAREALLPPLAAGERIATLAFSEAHDPWNLGAIEMTATASGDGQRLTGRKVFVLDGHVAHDLLVVARSGEELSLFRVAGDAAGLTREPLPALDPTRKLAQLDFDSTPAERIATGDVTGALTRVLARCCAALAAEQLGGTQRVLEMATEYAKTRLQFGRPIGSYQAIKHQCADMLVATEFARSAAYHVAFTDEDDVDAYALAAAMAKSYCSDAYFESANRNIQIHGGMGFTWEHSAHLYFKRAKASQILLGSPAVHREKVAAAIGVAA